jgi:uncharacterized membrane protein YciS (DUF1049 family)
MKSFAIVLICGLIAVSGAEDVEQVSCCCCFKQGAFCLDKYVFTAFRFKFSFGFLSCPHEFWLLQKTGDGLNVGE